MNGFGGGCRVLELQAVVVMGMLVSAVAFAGGGRRVVVVGAVGLVAFWMAACGLTLARWFAS